MAQHVEEIEVIANSSDAPTFENTIVAMEKSGALLDRVSTVFFSLIPPTPMTRWRRSAATWHRNYRPTGTTSF